MGEGEAARSGAGGDPVALCFSKPKTTEILTDWMRALARHEGVTDIMVWLSEYAGQCGCEDCAAALKEDITQHALEVQAVGRALDTLREDYPYLNARVLLTQGTYPDNDKILAATPPNVQVSYYCGGGRERSTYNSSRDPMIYPLLENYAAQGRWLGVYPQFTASYGTVCPWSGPQFIKHLIGEFVDKGLDCVCGYTVPNNQLHAFNVTAAAEWSWNQSGRSEREFAIAWATQRRIQNPEAVGDWGRAARPGKLEHLRLRARSHVVLRRTPPIGHTDSRRPPPHARPRHLALLRQCRGHRQRRRGMRRGPRDCRGVARPGDTGGDPHRQGLRSDGEGPLQHRHDAQRSRPDAG